MSKKGLPFHLVDEINKIPIEDLQEPQTSVVGPALEASKYYMDEDNLRLMFAKLIAASMDCKKNGYVQHSFVEIIKQLTPLDAQILKVIRTTEPIVDISLKSEDSNGGSITIYRDLFIHHSFPDNILNSISINNLSRLGLIDRKHDASFTDKDVYKPFKETIEYKKVEQMSSDNAKRGISDVARISEGIIVITNFGKTFRDICIN